MLLSKNDHYPKKDWLSFNMRSAGRFYLMVNQILINAGDRIGFQQNMENCPSKKQLFPFTFNLWSWYLVKSLYTPQEKNRLVGNLPYRRIWEDIEVEKSKVWKLMNNSLIFSKESFEFKKIKSNEHGHIHKASEYAKNPFLYLNFKSKSFVTNFILALWPFNWHKKLKYVELRNISWFFK